MSDVVMEKRRGVMKDGRVVMKKGRVGSRKEHDGEEFYTRVLKLNNKLNLNRF